MATPDSSLPLSTVHLLLYIRVKEPTLESLCRGRKTYEPPSYMTINTAIQQLLEIVQAREESAYNDDTKCVGLARLGSEDQMIVARTIRQLADDRFWSTVALPYSNRQDASLGGRNTGILQMQDINTALRQQRPF
ncbi:hypothetical protein RJT34_12996 [Clitoria ternatea]|uniref:Uncharacterized protein n=1 Tax=Clitoria ternatea TaxID=43366 RepID=A0AAN9JQ42_CLITE